MKVVANTLEPLIERWDDPGDYPNALAAGPLPSFDYMARLEGEIRVELPWSEYRKVRCWLKDDSQEWVMNEVDPELPEGILSVVWQVQVSGGERRGFCWLLHKPVIVTMWAEEIEPDPDWRGPKPDSDWQYHDQLEVFS